MTAASPKANFPALLQRFFLERLVQQRNVSPFTVAAYRDCFRLLLNFAQRHLGKAPEALALSDLDAPLMIAFLNYLECERHNTIRSRNARFAAVRAFLHFAAFYEPTALPVIQRVLAIPLKRFDRPLVGFLSRNEIQAILDAPDTTTWCGHRDRAMFMVFYNTGGRVSEITGLKVGDVVLNGCAAARLHGKGRKKRSVPLWKTTAAEINRWLSRTHLQAEQILFPGWSGTRLSRPAVTARLQLAVRRARTICPHLSQCRISPHLIRHSTAMHLLQAGVDITLIALWLGHENPTTTHMYVEADLAMKERALNAVAPPHLKRTRYQAPDRLLRFLETL
jgi:site-specific recombinase XerD